MSQEAHIFISYNREDSEFALRLARDLRSEGVNIWMDQLDIPPGTRWDRAVEQALRTCDRLLIILSPASVASENVMDEVAFALDREKQIVPVLYRHCEIPLRLLRLQYVDFTSAYNRRLTELLAELQGAEAPEMADAVAPPLAKPKLSPTKPFPWRAIAIGAAALLVVLVVIFVIDNVLGRAPTPAPATVATATTTLPVATTPSPTATPVPPTSTAVVIVPPTATPVLAPKVTPTPPPTDTPKPTPTETPKPIPTDTPKPTPTETPKPTPTDTPKPTPTETPKPTPTDTAQPPTPSVQGDAWLISVEGGPCARRFTLSYDIQIQGYDPDSVFLSLYRCEVGLSCRESTWWGSTSDGEIKYDKWWSPWPGKGTYYSGPIASTLSWPSDGMRTTARIQLYAYRVEGITGDVLWRSEEIPIRLEWASPEDCP